MPASLPFAPSGASSDLVQPVAVHQSDFTGYQQRIFSGFSIWRGEIIFPEISLDEELAAWRKFFADVEGGDGTFWAPIATAGPDERGGSVGEGYASGDRTVRPDDAGQPLPVAGDILQVWVTANPSVSECAAVEDADANGIEVGRSLMILREHGLSLRYRFVNPLCRAVPVDSDYGEVKAMETGFSGIGQISWVESIGQNHRDFYTE